MSRMPMDLYTRECLEAAQGKIPRLPDGSRPKSLRVFKSRWLELFGLAHPITPALWWGPAVLYGSWQGVALLGVARASAMFVLGLFLWSLFEYFLHRFVFHMPAHDDAGRFRRFMFHWYHHEFPNDSMRLLAPPLMSWTVGPAIWGLLRVSFGPVYMWPVFAGTALGYLSYDYIHYYTHHAKPTTALGKWIRSYHLHHHHDDDDSRFGVSSPLWDFVFGTYKPIKQRARAAMSQTTTTS